MFIGNFCCVSKKFLPRQAKRDKLCFRYFRCGKKKNMLRAKMFCDITKKTTNDLRKNITISIFHSKRNAEAKKNRTVLEPKPQSQ